MSSATSTPVVLRNLRRKAAKGARKRDGEQQPAAAACPSCSHKVRAGMRFCPKCGASQPQPAEGAGGVTRSLSEEVMSPRTQAKERAHSAEVLVSPRAAGKEGDEGDEHESGSEGPPVVVVVPPASVSQPLPKAKVGTFAVGSVSAPGSPPGAGTAAKALPGGPQGRPQKTWLSKVTARRAMSTGPTPAHDPVTGEFMALLSSSDEQVPNGPATGGGPSPPESRKKKKKRPDTVARALPHVLPPVDRRLTRDELFSGEEGEVNIDKLKQHLKREGRLEEEAAAELVRQAARLISREKTLLNLKAPMTVIGDIHGQYFDLVALMEQVEAGVPMLFLGDFVDRGYFGCEVTFYLLAMKVARPGHVHLLRGNHESRQVTQMYNFYRECKWKYSVALWEQIMGCFEQLPLAAVVTNGAGERFFCVHGGISPYVSSCEDVLEIDRFGEIPSDGAMCDLLWADPLTQCKEQPRDEWLEMRWDQNRQRKISFTFGWGVLEAFLENNNLQSVIRAHEVKQEGVEAMWFAHSPETRKYAPLYTVFSAPNYSDIYKNKGGFMVLGKEDGVRFETLMWTEHPYYLKVKKKLKRSFRVLSHLFLFRTFKTGWSSVCRF